MWLCAGDRGDVTPVPQAGGAGRDAWRASVTALLRHAASLQPLALLHTVHTVLKVYYLLQGILNLYLSNILRLYNQSGLQQKKTCLAAALTRS